MKVCHIVGHGDQRAIKESLALRDKGHEITFLTKSVNSYAHCFNDFRIFGTDDLLPQAIRTTDCDIYHIHCKPSCIPRLAIQTLKEMGKPYVYDVHDLDIVRFGRTCSDELFALMNAPYLVFPDKAIEQKASDVIFQYFAKKPETLSLLPYFSLMDMVYPQIRPNPTAVKERMRHIVYEGNIVLPAIENINSFPYYDLRFTALTWIKWGYVFHIYPVGIDFNQCKQHYEMTGATLHQPLEYPYLISDMSQWGWGFFGSFVPDVQANNTFANKIFDYICAGLPVLVMNAQRMGQFLTETGFGLEVKGFDDFENLKNNQDLWEGIQTKILSERSAWAMEENIEPLIKFYEKGLDDSRFKEKLVQEEDIPGPVAVEEMGMVTKDADNGGDPVIDIDSISAEPIQVYDVGKQDGL
jgi:hypothetical protein